MEFIKEWASKSAKALVIGFCILVVFALIGYGVSSAKYLGGTTALAGLALVLSAIFIGFMLSLGEE